GLEHTTNVAAPPFAFFEGRVAHSSLLLACVGKCNRLAGPPFAFNASNIPQMWLPHPSRFSKGGNIDLFIFHYLPKNSETFLLSECTLPSPVEGEFRSRS